MLDLITHAANDDHINDARMDKFEEALDQLIICRAVTVECIGVATNVAATRIDRALRNGPDDRYFLGSRPATTLLELQLEVTGCVGRAISSPISFPVAANNARKAGRSGRI